MSSTAELLDSALEGTPHLPEIEVSPPTWATGSLALVHTWWLERGGTGFPTAAFLAPASNSTDPIGDGVQAAGQSAGATVIVPTVIPTREDDIASRAIIATLANREASAVCHQPVGMPDASWMHLCTDVREQSSHLVVHRGEPLALAQTAHSNTVSFFVGAIAAASSRGIPVLLDSSAALAAALIVDRLSYRAKAWWGWASTSPDQARHVAAERLTMDPLLNLGVFDDDVTGARSVIALLNLTVG